MLRDLGIETAGLLLKNQMILCNYTILNTFFQWQVRLAAQAISQLQIHLVIQRWEAAVAAQRRQSNASAYRTRISRSGIAIFHCLAYRTSEALKRCAQSFLQLSVVHSYVCSSRSRGASPAASPAKRVGGRSRSAANLSVVRLPPHSIAPYEQVNYSKETQTGADLIAQQRDRMLVARSSCASY